LGFCLNHSSTFMSSLCSQFNSEVLSLLRSVPLSILGSFEHLESTVSHLQSNYPHFATFQFRAFNDVAAVLSCGFCKQLPLIPLVDCATGLLCCKFCRDNIPQISTISVPLTNRYYNEVLELQCNMCGLNCKIGENLGGLLEHILQNCQFPCRNYGCNKKLLLSTYQEHLQDCKDEVIWCPFAAFLQETGITEIPFGCSHRNSRSELAKHVQENSCDKKLVVLQYGLKTAAAAAPAAAHADAPAPAAAPAARVAVRGNQTHQRADRRSAVISREELSHVRSTESNNSDGMHTEPALFKDNWRKQVASIVIDDFKIHTRTYEDQVIHIVQSDDQIYIRWTDLAAPVVPDPSARSREVRDLIDAKHVRFFGVSTPQLRNKAFHVTVDGVREWLEYWEEDEWNNHPYKSWLQNSFLPSLTALAEPDHVRERAEGSNNAKRRKKLPRSIGTIAKHVLDDIYNDPERRDRPLQMNRSELMSYVKSFLTREEKSIWTQNELDDNLKSSFDFSRALTGSKYKTNRDREPCVFRNSSDIEY
jgi:hypothetical protein